MKKLLTVDIETCCNVPDCNGFGHSHKCDHALRAETGRITLIGVWDEETKKGETYNDVGAFLDYLNDFERDIALIGHNFAFDLKFLIAAGAPLSLIDKWEHDSQVMAHTCTNKISEAWLAQYEVLRQEANKHLPHGVSHRTAGLNSLKTNAPYWLGVDPFWEDPTNHESVEYVLKDVKYTHLLALRLKKELEELSQFDFYKSFMMPAAKMLLRASLKGVELNKSEFEMVELEYQSKIQELESKLDHQWAAAHNTYHLQQVVELRKKYDAMCEKAVAKAKNVEKTYTRYQKLFEAAEVKIERKLNYNSPSQLLWLLRDFLGYNIIDDEGKESTGAAVLHKLASEGKDDVANLLAYREAHKVLTMYLPTYKELCAEDGAIKPNFNLTGTRTGRLSSSAPNMQQVPSKLYKLFKPREGYSLIDFDYGAIEAVLIALYSDDEVLTEIVTKGLSIHDYNTKYAVFPNETSSVAVGDIKATKPKLRQIAKTLGFSTFYGAGNRRIQLALSKAGMPVGELEARDILDRLHKLYPNVYKFHREITDTFEKGAVLNNLIGRPIKIHSSKDAYMKGFNTLIQSSASDLLIAAALRAERKFKEEGLDAYPILFVHDALICEARDDVAERAKEIIEESMLNWDLKNSFGKIPLTIDGKIAKIWSK